MAKRGRKPKYTDAERKQLKHYRNKIYYYKKKVEALQRKIEEITSQITENLMQIALAPSFHNVRSLMSDDEAYELLYLFNSDVIYFNRDFREVLIEEGYNDLADRLSQMGGYGTLDEYIAQAESSEYNEEILRELTVKHQYMFNVMNEALENYARLLK